MASVNSLTFDVADCDLVRRTEQERIWVGAERVVHSLRFNHDALRWPFDLTDPNTARSFYRSQCERNGGVMLEIELITAAGVEGLSGVFKYRSPIPDSLGMAYVGIVWLPFRDCLFQINVEAVEQGVTGLRESLVGLFNSDQWPIEPGASIPVVNSQEDLDNLAADAMRKPLPRLPSDDPKYDASLPSHPLSLVRARLARVIATARLADDARALKPYRIDR